MVEKRHGGCLCGAVGWQVQGKEKFVANCYCGQCRKAQGAAFATYAGYLEKQFEVTIGADHMVDFATETGATRSFCGRCGTTMLFRSPRWAGEVHVSLTSFQDPENLAPRGHFYVDHGAPWYKILDGLPQYGGPQGDTLKEKK